jgi:hypothetical protein
MGLRVPQLETPHGVMLTNAYVGLAKDSSNTLLIRVSDGIWEYLADVTYRVYVSEEARRTGRPPVMESSLVAPVPRDAVGELFPRIFACLHETFEGAKDVL